MFIIKQLPLTTLPPSYAQAEEFFAAHAAPKPHAAAAANLARFTAQLPRPVMISRTDTSITMNVNRRAKADEPSVSVDQWYARQQNHDVHARCRVCSGV